VFSIVYAIFLPHILMMSQKIPTVHLGAAASQMERRGIMTDRGNINREIEFTNNQIKQLRARVGKVKSWLDATNAKTPPTLYDTFMELINSREGDSQSAKIKHLKLTANTLFFIQSNDIKDLVSLADKVNEMQRDCNAAYERKKKIERRVKTLDKHIEQSEIFKKYRKFKTKYNALYADYKAIEKTGGLFAKSKAQKALNTANEYHESYRSELAQFATAEKYLKDVLQGRYDPKKLPPIKTWTDECETCRQELGGINSECAVLKREVESAEAIKRFAVKLMLPDEPQQAQQKTKTWEVEL
jgi:hypothetical protein